MEIWPMADMGKLVCLLKTESSRSMTPQSLTMDGLKSSCACSSEPCCSLPSTLQGNNIIPSSQGFEMLSYYGDGAIKVPKIARTIIISDMVGAK